MAVGRLAPVAVGLVRGGVVVRFQLLAVWSGGEVWSGSGCCGSGRGGGLRPDSDCWPSGRGGEL